jgi:hypothetical protein
VSEINEAALPFPHWNTGKPPDSMLRVVFERGDYKALGGNFLVDNGRSVAVLMFHRPPPSEGRSFSGYWELPDFKPVRWMQLPESVGGSKEIK